MQMADLEDRMNIVGDFVSTTFSNGRAQSGIIKEIKLSDIQDFENHPFKVVENAELLELANSINQNGVLEPVLVRPLPNGKYQMISGHRRKKACELINKDTIPCRVKDLTKEEATIAMVESNYHREKILPSEKAFAYKMRLEAEKRQGKRTDLTLSPMDTKLDNAARIAKEFNESRANVFRYIRLTELIPNLLQMVDNDVNKVSPSIAFRVGAELSYLSKEEQEWVLDSIEAYDATPSIEQARNFKIRSQKNELTKSYIDETLGTRKGNQVEQLKIDMSSLRRKIPRTVPQMQYVKYIEDALDYYNKYLEKQKIRSR